MSHQNLFKLHQYLIKAIPINSKKKCHMKTFILPTYTGLALVKQWREVFLSQIFNELFLLITLHMFNHTLLSIVRVAVELSGDAHQKLLFWSTTMQFQSTYQVIFLKKSKKIIKMPKINQQIYFPVFNFDSGNSNIVLVFKPAGKSVSVLSFAQ